MDLKHFLEDDALRNLGETKVSFLVEGKYLSSDGVVTMRNDEALGSGYICLSENAKKLTLNNLKDIFKSNDSLHSLSFFYNGYMYVLESAEAIQMTSDESEFIVPLKYRAPYTIENNDDITVSSLNNAITDYKDITGVDFKNAVISIAVDGVEVDFHKENILFDSKHNVVTFKVDSLPKLYKG